MGKRTLSGLPKGGREIVRDEKRDARKSERKRGFHRRGKFPFLKLPTEIKDIIFKQLNPITSTCIGLTCKELWFMHKIRYNRQIPLLTRSLHPGVGYLPFLLAEWMAPRRTFRFGRTFYTDRQYHEELEWREESAEHKRQQKRERKAAKRARDLAQRERAAALR